MGCHYAISGKTKDFGDEIFLEDTDAPLPETLNQKTRYAFFSEVAKGESLLSCRARICTFGGRFVTKLCVPNFKKIQ